MSQRSREATRESTETLLPACVYLVDQDTKSLRWLDALLRHWNLKVLRYPSAEQFFESVEPEKRGVLIAGMDPSGISGLELHRELVKRGYRLPTIVVATNGDVPQAVRALKDGAADFLEKPIVPQILLRRIRELLDRPEETPTQ